MSRPALEKAGNREHVATIPLPCRAPASRWQVKQGPPTGNPTPLTQVGLDIRIDGSHAGGKWHKLERIDGVSFYEGVDIQDADDPERVYSFRLSDPPHAACFRMSDSDHGNNIRISYSNCLSFYELPDGTKWAEHGYYYDKDDLKEHVQHENRRLPVARCEWVCVRLGCGVRAVRVAFGG